MYFLKFPFCFSILVFNLIVSTRLRNIFFFFYLLYNVSLYNCTQTFTTSISNQSVIYKPYKNVNKNIFLNISSFYKSSTYETRKYLSCVVFFSSFSTLIKNIFSIFLIRKFSKDFYVNE